MRCHLPDAICETLGFANNDCAVREGQATDVQPSLTIRLPLDDQTVVSLAPVYTLTSFPMKLRYPSPPRVCVTILPSTPDSKYFAHRMSLCHAISISTLLVGS